MRFNVRWICSTLTHHKLSQTLTVDCMVKDAEVSLVAVAVTMTTDQNELSLSLLCILPDYLSTQIMSTEVLSSPVLF